MTNPSWTYRLGSGRTFSQLGDDQAGKSLQSLGRQLYKEGQGIIAESQGLVPVDTTALKSSAYTAEPVYDGTEVKVVFGYGGPAAQINPKTGELTDSYALYVHENLDAFHKVGTAKFLEMPFDQAKEGMDERVANNMRADLHGLGGFTDNTPSGGTSLEPEGGMGI